MVSGSVGLFVAAAVAGWLALNSTLPWWAILLILVAILIFVTGLVGTFAVRFRASPYTPVIESGERLVARMRAVTDVEPTPSVREAWHLRAMDWIAEADAVVAEHAKPRLGAFRANVLFASHTPSDATPDWLMSDLTDIELRLEKLYLYRGRR